VPTLSLLICTMNRPDELDTALESVRAGSAQPTEIIVSDDGDGSARAVAERHGATWVEGPHRGLGPNRNRAIAAASGELIAFIDDDVLVSPEFVAVALSRPTDRITTGWELNFSSDPAHKVTPRNADFLGFQRLVPRMDDLRAIVINATVFPAALFAAAAFDERTRYGYEELDMARHAVALGTSIEYCDELWVEHHPSAAGRSGYAAALDISRLHLTHQAYAVYEHRPLKAAAYDLVAAAHHVAASLRARRSLGSALRTISTARRLRRRPAAVQNS